MKTILAPVSTSFFVRNFLRTDALKILQEKGTRLVFLVPKAKLEYYQKEFSGNNLVFEVLPEVKNLLSERFFNFLETASIHTKTVFMLNKANLYRKGSKLNFIRRVLVFFWRMIFWNLGRFYFWRQFVRKIYSFLPPNQEFEGIVERVRPDLVFLPTMILAEDYLLLKSAKRRGIKTLGMTLSWDNFYSKTFLRLHPGRLLVHTKEIKKQAEKFGDYPQGQTVVVGIPQYDRYFRKEGISSREEFFKKIGVVPSKKLLLYAFSGKAGIEIDFNLLEIVHEIISEKKLSEEVSVLVRPYPKYDFPEDKISLVKTKYNFAVKEAMTHVGRGKESWEFDEEALNFLAQSLNYADIVITTYSTFFIEAAIFGKPLIAIAFDGREKRNYWNSALRFFDWDHLRELKPHNGVWLVKNKEELAEALGRYLKDPDYLSEGRRKIVLAQCGFTDGRSAARLSKTILEILGLK